MSTNFDIFKLLVITTTDALCFGMIVSFISPHLLNVDGDHVNLGTFSAGSLICQLLSDDIVNAFSKVYGKKFSLFLILNIVILSHLMLIVTNFWWIIVLGRLLFSITNQSQRLCRELTLEMAPADKQQFYALQISLLSSFGYIFGPIMGGYLFYYKSGFSLIACTAIFLTIINSLLLVGMTREKFEPSETPILLFEKSVEDLENLVKNLKQFDYKRNWDILAIKFLFTASITIFFTKFTQILKYNFEASSILIGYTAAYKNFLVFTLSYLSSIMKNHLNYFDTVTHLKTALFILAGALLILCYAPNYELYLFMCIPIILARTFINSMWKRLCESRTDQILNKLTDSISIIAGLTVPIVFGMLCNVIQHHAVIIFSILPLVVSIYIIEIHVIPNSDQYNENKNK